MCVGSWHAFLRYGLKRGGLVALALLWAGIVAGELVIDLGDVGTIHDGFRIAGHAADDQSGFSVSGVGDVNLEGLDDVIVGAPYADPGGRANAGSSWVVFGKRNSAPVSLGDLLGGGYRINGIASRDLSGVDVSGAGDVDNDGRADVAAGTLGAGSNDVGQGYVVRGKSDAATVELGALGNGGFSIDGTVANGATARWISGAGDVNGDGMADVVVGAESADSMAGEAYVVFGKQGTAPVNLGALGSDGFRIYGAGASARVGHQVSGAGDVNGDGLADILVGAWLASPGGRTNAGACYVVFGKTSSAAVNLASLGSAGFRIEGIDPGDKLGNRAAAAGDVNGDGLADLVIGAINANAADAAHRIGESYVVFGKADASPVLLGSLGSGGFRIDGSSSNHQSGWCVSGAGDFNGDGRSDILIGSVLGATEEFDPGEVCIIFGKADSSPVSLGSTQDVGVRFLAAQWAGGVGNGASAAGDVDGDGLADVVLGDYLASLGNLAQCGESYVVFSRQTPLASAVYKAPARANDARRIAVGICGDGSDDDSPSSRCWIDFADGTGPGASGSSMQTVTLHRSAAILPQGPDSADAHWQLATDRTGWTSCAVTLKYTDAEIAGLAENGLRLFRSSTPDGPWTPLETTVDISRNRASATVSELGFFALAAEPQLDAFVIE